MLTILEKIDENQERINQARPLEQSRVRNLREYFRIGLTYSSMHITVWRSHESVLN